MYIRVIELEAELLPSPVSRLSDPWLEEQGIEVWVKRDDLLHPVISGNKWRKLKYNLELAFNGSASCLVSMGGAYSNHLHALAYIGMKSDIKTRAFIRGEEPAILNPTLLDLKKWGMQLEFVTRSAYREIRLHENARNELGLPADHYWIPEGGAVLPALTGVAEVISEIDKPYDVLCVACGTGATLAGLVSALPANKSALGIAALKGASFLNHDVTRLLEQASISQSSNWTINQDYHFGGFAKTTEELSAFIQRFEQMNNIPLEPVYTGKMFFAIYDLIQQHYFKPGQRLLALHTGGLQGNRGFF